MNNALLSLSQGAQPYSPESIVELLAHSLGLGSLLMVLAILIQLSSRSEGKKGAPALSPELRRQSAVLQAANVLFICFGITAIMILVSNDLARAFAIAAAIAMVRFRVKMSESAASAIFFAVVIGMACGVGQVAMAWGIGLVFAIAQAALLLTLRLLAEKPSVASKKIETVSEPA